MVVVVPKVTSIFESLDQALPWYTPLLIFVSNFAAGYWWLILIAASAAASAWFRRWKKTPDGRLKWDTLLPQGCRSSAGSILMLAVARFSRTLATLLAERRAAAHGDGHRARTCSTTRCSRRWSSDAIGSIREGESIAEPLKRSGQFPADRHAHDRGRREERPARADARERRRRLRRRRSRPACRR